MARPYHQFCGVAKALDVVGERWTLLIVRDLLLGPRRFGELQDALVGIPPALLTTRLKEAQARGVVTRDRPRGRYALTDLGRELEPVVLALGRFGARYLAAPDTDDRMDIRWAMVSLKRRYLGSQRSWRLGFVADGREFTVQMGPKLGVWDGLQGSHDAVVKGGAKAVGAALVGLRTPDELGDALQIEGEPDALPSLLRSLGVGRE